jgi:hypothetical protein
LAVVAAESPIKETPTKAKRGRKVAQSPVAKIETDDEKPAAPETPKPVESAPRASARERTPTAKTPKGRRGRGGSVGRDDDEDPYAFKEPEPFEAKFETPRKSPAGKKSATAKSSDSGAKKSGRPAKQDSEESADSRCRCHKTFFFFVVNRQAK